MPPSRAQPPHCCWKRARSWFCSQHALPVARDLLQGDSVMMPANGFPPAPSATCPQVIFPQPLGGGLLPVSPLAPPTLACSRDQTLPWSRGFSLPTLSALLASPHPSMARFLQASCLLLRQACLKWKVACLFLCRETT